MDAGRKWILLLLDIITYEFDGNDSQLLSAGADRLIERHPVLGRVLIILAGGIITAHLSNILPPRFDPMSKTAWRALRRG